MLTSALPLKLRTGLILMTGLVAFLSAVVPQLNQKWDGKIPTAIYFLVILVLSLIAAILLQYFYIKDLIDGLGRSALGITRGILVVGLCWIVCGAPIQGLKRERSLFLLICIMGFLSLSVFSNLNGGIFVSYAKLSEGRSDDTELNHLVVGEAATFLLLLAYAFAPHGWRLLTFSLSIAMLFSLGGRSAFFSYFLAVGLHHYLVAPSGRKWWYPRIQGRTRPGALSIAQPFVHSARCGSPRDRANRSGSCGRGRTGGSAWRRESRTGFLRGSRCRSRVIREPPLRSPASSRHDGPCSPSFARDPVPVDPVGPGNEQPADDRADGEQGRTGRRRSEHAAQVEGDEQGAKAP